MILYPVLSIHQHYKFCFSRAPEASTAKRCVTSNIIVPILTFNVRVCLIAYVLVYNVIDKQYLLCGMYVTIHRQGSMWFLCYYGNHVNANKIWNLGKEKENTFYVLLGKF